MAKAWRIKSIAHAINIASTVSCLHHLYGILGVDNPGAARREGVESLWCKQEWRLTVNLLDAGCVNAMGKRTSSKCYPSLIQPWPQSPEAAGKYATKYGFMDDRGGVSANEANEGPKGDFRGH